MARNRLQSGLSCAVIVIEAGESGGAMKTVDRARRQGRLVCTIKWPQMGERRAGPARLLAEGAEPIDGPEQVAAFVRALYFHREQMRRSHAEASQQQLFGDQ
jgi:DNA processing protein